MPAIIEERMAVSRVDFAIRLFALVHSGGDHRAIFEADYETFRRSSALVIVSVHTIQQRDWPSSPTWGKNPCSTFTEFMAEDIEMDTTPQCPICRSGNGPLS